MDENMKLAVAAGTVALAGAVVFVLTGAKPAPPPDGNPEGQINTVGFSVVAS